MTHAKNYCALLLFTVVAVTFVTACTPEQAAKTQSMANQLTGSATQPTTLSTDVAAAKTVVQIVAPGWGSTAVSLFNAGAILLGIIAGHLATKGGAQAAVMQKAATIVADPAAQSAAAVVINDLAAVAAKKPAV